MENVTLGRAAEIVKALTPQEQSQLRAMIDSWQAEAPSETTPEQERRFAEHLLAIGMLEHIPTGYPGGVHRASAHCRSGGTRLRDDHPGAALSGLLVATRGSVTWH